jgi:glycosyltransferase involved in cell wall biosynthesis
MPYCVDNEYFRSRAVEASLRREELRKELDLKPDTGIILYASKFQPRKRPDDLLEAYRRMLPRFEQERAPYLLFVGEGELRPQLEKIASAQGLERVRFLGFRNQSELPALFDLCDVFVLASMAEPWGLVVNEVMNASRAVIVSDQVGCGPDLVHNGDNGFIVPAGDCDALARALYDTVGNLANARRMGEASRRIISSWSFEQDIAGLCEALDAVLSREALPH